MKLFSGPLRIDRCLDLQSNTEIEIKSHLYLVEITDSSDGLMFYIRPGIDSLDVFHSYELTMSGTNFEVKTYKVYPSHYLSGVSGSFVRFAECNEVKVTHNEIYSLKESSLPATS